MDDGRWRLPLISGAPDTVRLPAETDDVVDEGVDEVVDEVVDAKPQGGARRRKPAK